MWSAAVAGVEATKVGHLRACLQQTGLIRSVVEWSVSSPEQVRQSLKESIPDILVLGLTGDVEASFAFAAQLRRMSPATRIIACSPQQQPDPQLLLQAMRSGVQEFLPAPISADALRETLTRFLRESASAHKHIAEKLIAVMGSKGGVGTSTVAVNLAVQLVQLTQKRVVLLDLARPVGHVTLMLDLRPRFSVVDAAENLDRLDGHFFSGLLTHHKTGLAVLAGVSRPEEWQRIPTPALPGVVNVAQSTFDYVLMDYGSVYSLEWLSAMTLRLAKMILLVAESNVPSLWTLERHFSALAALGREPDWIRIIINRWNRGDEQALKSLEKTIGRPIFARLPNDFRQVSEAINLGTPLSKNHNNPLVSQFRQVARLLAGQVPPEPTERDGLRKLFPFSKNR